MGSNNNNPTENHSKFLDHHIRHIQTTFNSYFKGTSHLLRKIEHIFRNHTFPDGTALATVDVAALYRNILIDEGTRGVKEMM